MDCPRANPRLKSGGVVYRFPGRKDAPWRSASAGNRCGVQGQCARQPCGRLDRGRPSRTARRARPEKALEVLVERIVPDPQYPHLPDRVQGGARRAKVAICGVPKGIRTPVTAVKGRCPGPLDDGDPAARELRREQPVLPLRRGTARLHARRLVNNASLGPQAHMCPRPSALADFSGRATTDDGSSRRS